MSNTVGQDTSVYLANGIKDRYFYGLRRTDEGTLFIGKVDQLSANDPVSINNPGNIDDNFKDFDQGYDFYEGRDLNHAKPFPNLRYEQFRWDDVNLNYYINSEGELVVRINSNVGDGEITYPQTDESVTVQTTVFTLDKTNYLMDSNEITFDRG
jgi:hypothetical protein|tara:strand:- start:1068 stop:1529 length:462 start_codon:yes stop_codon:yes gene_type:complete